MAGIYEILNSVNGKRYIGSAVRPKQRQSQHWNRLQKNSHVNRRLQAAWDKHGASSFVFRVLLVCNPKDLLFYEQACIEGIAPEYNLAPVAGSQLGYRFSEDQKAKLAARPSRKWTDEQKARVSAALRGRVVSAATRARLSNANKGKSYNRGRKLTPEHIAKIVAANRGRKRTVEQRARIAASRRGYKTSDETKAKLSLAGRGRKNSAESIAKSAASNRGRKRTPEQIARWVAAMTWRSPSAETRAKISAAGKGRIVTEATREKIGNAHRGKTISLEARAKMSAAKLGKTMSAQACRNMSASVRARGPEYHARLSISKMGNKNSLGRKHPPNVLVKIAAASKAMWAARRAAKQDNES